MTGIIQHCSGSSSKGSTIKKEKIRNTNIGKKSQIITLYNDMCVDLKKS